MRKDCGFSLVELSIMLVILGLLVGGVLSGRSLIRAAELRAVGTERNLIVTSMNSFLDRYFSLPGDMARAYDFWGATCGTDSTTQSTGCNGDGDGIIKVETVGEHLKMWEHVVRAGLIEGGYDGTGVADVGGNLMLSNENNYRSKASNNGWAYTKTPEVAGELATDIHILTYGQIQNTSALAFLSINHGEAWSIDTKIDDGWANTGKMRGLNNVECTDQPNDPYSIALSGENAQDCIFHFFL